MNCRQIMLGRETLSPFSFHKPMLSTKSCLKIYSFNKFLTNDTEEQEILEIGVLHTGNHFA